MIDWYVTPFSLCSNILLVIPIRSRSTLCIAVSYAEYLRKLVRWKSYTLFVIRLHKSGYVTQSHPYASGTHAHNATVLCFEWNETELSIILLPLHSCEKEYRWLKNFGIFYHPKRENFCCIFNLRNNTICSTFEERQWYFVVCHTSPFMKNRKKWRYHHLMQYRAVLETFWNEKFFMRVSNLNFKMIDALTFHYKVKKKENPSLMLSYYSYNKVSDITS